MEKSKFSFYLPDELIAQEPLSDRSSSKLLVMDRKTGKVRHDVFKNIVCYLKKGDCLVLNNTKVIPARLIGEREDTGGKVEILLLKQREKNIWEVLVSPGKRAKKGFKIIFGKGILIGEIVEILDDGNRIIKFLYKGIFEKILDKIGNVPLPHYIEKKLIDKTRYQTVYAKEDGSVAAPTAGLHFTEELILDLKNKGINIAYVTLHVGLGTFRPVKEENILNHKMHEEFYSIEKGEAKIINDTKAKGGRIIAVGTTSCRTLESCVKDFKVEDGSGYTNIFIYPGYEFKIVDALITNFHLPESTLMMLISGFSGLDNVMKAYKIAIKYRYRFFSFGDAMFIY